MYDLFYIGRKDKQFTRLKTKFLSLKIAEKFEYAQKKATTKFFWCIWSDLLILDDFDFDYVPDVYSQDIPHVFKNTTDWYGVWLCPKNRVISQKEIEHRFLVFHKQVEIDASCYRNYEKYFIDTYDDYLYAMENCQSEMFWATSKNIDTSNFNFNMYFTHDDVYNRNENHAYIHRVNNKDYYNGLFLFSKRKPVTKKEIEHRHLVSRKEWDIVASTSVQYDIFNIETYDDYLYALENSKTELFWIIPNNINISDKFKFDLYFTHDNEYDRKANHVFLNGSYYDGVVLCSKYSEISKREFEYRFITHRKEHNVVASIPNSYDIIFISYNEPNADKNYEDLLKIAPYAKRVHGVKGIHQAHIAAANKSDTDMFFVVDGDARILDSFSFNYQVAHWNRNTVHVWHSINPINGLVYGYGGVKLLPKNLTLNMDVNSVDMSTSISKNFKVIDKISNVTAFDTDPFNTWKSAFRECAKLASKIINRQDNDETETNLKIWTSVGEYKEFGEYAIKGAKAGKEFGFSNKSDLSLINDFEWLERKFREG